MDFNNVLIEGTKVKIKLGNVKAIISAIIIRRNVLTYELTYFSNGEYAYVTLENSEFDVIEETEVLHIGFK